MKILIFGDIIGKPGRLAVEKIIPELKKEYKADFVMANGENLAHGNSVTELTLGEIMEAGVNFITTGDHIWDRKNAGELLDNSKFPLLRPANYPEGSAGPEYKIVKAGGANLAVINLMGRVFMKGSLDCPFRKLDKILKEISTQVKIVIVDIHAEATSEKKALGYYANGRVSVVFGTHTHIPTNDIEILSQKTAYITDVGMTGPKESVIGVDKDASISHFLTQMPFEYKIAEQEEVEINAICVKIDEATGRALKIEQIRKTVEIKI